MSYSLCCERSKYAPQARNLFVQSMWCTTTAATGGDEAETSQRRGGDGGHIAARPKTWPRRLAAT
eukprot:5966682-Pyramimonas_sp.AAC.1